MRCLTLAKALRARGEKCTFLCHEHERNLIEKIREEGFECIAFARRSEACVTKDADEPSLTHAQWLGASWQNDAKESIHAMGLERVDWLIIDHYR